MKLVIQIPCYNEEESLPEAFAELPRSIPGITEIEYLIIDDGSSDKTVEVAKKLGAHKIASLPQNRGLAKAFTTGLETALNMGADIVVNTDADNQYDAKDIPKLIQPILEGKADIVIGERPISNIAHFSPIKKALQKLGSWAVRQISGTDVKDAPSGFRAFSRKAAAQLNVFNEYTYTLETIIQAGHKGIAVVSVPVGVNGETRESRLVKSISSYVKRSVLTMLRIFIVYRPVRFFIPLALLLFIPGIILSLRFLYFFAAGAGDGHIQSIILSVFLMGSSLLVATLGVLADLISVNRKLLEQLKLQLHQLLDQDRIKHG